MRLWLAAFLFLALGTSGCGNSNNSGGGNNNAVATTPNTYCLQNSGSGCSGYGQVDPRFIQPYPYGANGYYGYNSGYYSGCQQYPGRWAPIYGANNGLGCMNIGMAGGYSPYYSQFPSAYGYGGYPGVATYCTVGVSMWWGSWGGNGGGATCVYGTCQPFQPGSTYGFCR